jgi:hypothetical protein
MKNSSQTSVRQHRARNAERAPTRAQSKRPRSAVTSGRKLFVEGSPNSAWSRRYHDLVVGHANDLGGHDMLSNAQMSLIRRAAAIEAELERLDARLSSGEEVDMDTYARVAGHLRRLFETLGLKRVPRLVAGNVINGKATPEPSWSPLRAQLAREREDRDRETTEATLVEDIA